MQELLLTLVVFCLSTGLLTCRIARTRGRDPAKWFFIGLLSSLFGLAILLMLKRRGGNAAA